MMPRGALIVGLLGTACAGSSRGADVADCPHVPYSMGANVRARQLGGTYVLTLVATAGDSIGRRISGRLMLGATRRSDAVLVGTTEVAVEQVAAYRVGALDAEGDSAPGVLVFEQPGERPEIMLRFGSGVNARGVLMFEGEYTVLTVHRIDSNGFVGSWRSGAVETRASGHFCAVRAG